VRGHNTVLLYPAWWYLVARGALYFALLMIPIALASWLADLFPASVRPVTEFISGVVVMPLLYWGLYELLRRTGARSQSFIYLLVLLFLIIAVADIYGAFNGSGWSRLPMGLMTLAYAGGFAWIAWRGYKANENDAAAAYNAEQEAQINMHAQAILRAKELEQRQANGG
jgi:hypothetical protein